MFTRRTPPDAPSDELADTEVTRRSVLLSLKALGVARVPHIRAHFTRGRWRTNPKLQIDARLMAAT